MSKKDGKTKKGEPQQKGAHDQGGFSLALESPDGKDAAIKGACGSSSVTKEDDVHSEHTDDREEVDGSESSQATGGHSKPGKNKKTKKGKEEDQKGRVIEEAEQPQRTKSMSLFKRKKRSQSSQPPLSTDEAQLHVPQRRHTHSELSQGGEVFTSGISAHSKKISLDSKGVSIQWITKVPNIICFFQIDQLFTCTVP